LSVGEQKRISDISDQRSGGEEKRKAYTESTEDTEFAEKKKAREDSWHKKRAMQNRTALRGLRSE